MSSTDADRINALANEAMESIETDDAEDYAHARAAIEAVIKQAIAASTADRTHGVCSQPCAMCHAEEIARVTAELAEARATCERQKWELDRRTEASKQYTATFESELTRLRIDLDSTEEDRLSVIAERDAARAELTKSAHEHAVMRQRLEKTQDEAAALRIDRDEWKQQHENALACWRRESAHFWSLYEAEKTEADAMRKVLVRIAGMEAQGASLNPGHYMNIAIRIAGAALKRHDGRAKP